jgi:hypothetical protein
MEFRFRHVIFAIDPIRSDSLARMTGLWSSLELLLTSASAHHREVSVRKGANSQLMGKHGLGTGVSMKAEPPAENLL